MRWLPTLVFALVTAAGISSAPAATVSFEVTGQPVLDAIPLTWSVGGGASLDSSGAVPVVSMPVTGISPLPGGAQYSMGTSTVTAMAFGTLLEFTDFTLNSFLGLLFSDVTVTEGSDSTILNNLLVGIIRDNGDVEISEPLADLLANTRLAGAQGFIVANVTLPAPIPLPAALPLYAGALALSTLALLRRLRGRGPADRQAA